jgi:hypothetical protein
MRLWEAIRQFGYRLVRKIYGWDERCKSSHRRAMSRRQRAASRSAKTAKTCLQSRGKRSFKVRAMCRVSEAKAMRPCDLRCERLTLLRFQMILQKLGLKVNRVVLHFDCPSVPYQEYTDREGKAALVEVLPKSIPAFVHVHSSLKTRLVCIVGLIINRLGGPRWLLTVSLNERSRAVVRFQAIEVRVLIGSYGGWIRHAWHLTFTVRSPLEKKGARQAVVCSL